MEYNIEKRIIEVALELRDISKSTHAEMESIGQENLANPKHQSKLQELMTKPTEVSQKLFNLLDEYDVMNGKVLQ